MNKTCRQCAAQFEITDDDLKFYDKVSPVFGGKKYLISPPTLCPQCRQLRRIAFINEINLFKNKCAATGKEVISNYPPDSLHKVYDQEYWWSDKWDALEYGRDFDFGRPFFEQYQELFVAVPKPNVFTGYQYDENCAYTNGAGKNKNCYLIFDSDYCRDCYYSYSINHTTNCIDCYRVRQSELCYENVDCRNCYSSKYLQNCLSCSDSAFLDDCRGCKNCFMCFNLQQKEYWIYNKAATKEQYLELISQLSSRKNVENFKKEFAELKAKYPKKYYHGMQNENVTGDYLYNCKNVHESFDCNDAWDCKYIYQSFGDAIKDCMDFNECGDFAELTYESSSCGYNINNIKFGLYVLDQCSDQMYCSFCHFSSSLFGCIGLKRKKYCILNKQYSKEEYETLVPKIIEQMQKTGEWGEFFPASMSPFAYNESFIMDYAPLTREEALKRGFRWRDFDKKKIPQTIQVPDDIKEVGASIANEVLACVECGTNFKIIPQELKFYQDKLIPIPDKCFICRHKARKESRNPRHLWDRKCNACGKDIRTSYAPERPTTPLNGGLVYCEACYLKEVY
jgi:Zn ribbon nucleic-acid-binding protein